MAMVPNYMVNPLEIHVLLYRTEKLGKMKFGLKD